MRFQRAYENNLLIYRKIPKISPGAYIFQRPFLRGLFLKGLVFGGAYLSRKICVSKSIELALLLEVNLPFFALFYFVFEGNFPSTSPRGGAYIWKGDWTEGFLCYRFGGGLFLEGLIHQGAYFRNFTVSQRREVSVKHTFSWGCTWWKKKCSLFQAPRLSRSALLSPLHPYYLRAWNRLKKTLLVFLVLKRFILREPETAHRVYVLITGGQEFESRRKDSLGT